MKILLIDGDPYARDRLVAGFHLQWPEGTLVSAVEGEAGLRAFHEHQPDVVVLNAALPDGGSFELLQQIRRLSNVPVIMTASRRDEDSEVRGLELGADGYVAEASTPATLLARVKAVLRRAELSGLTGTPAPTVDMPKVQNLTAGIGIDPSQKIQKPGSVFEPDTAEIAFSLEVLDVARETSVDIQLFYLGTNDIIMGPTQKLVPNQGVSRVGFIFSKPDKGWPAGQYKAVFFLNGKEAGSTGFSVQQQSFAG